MGISKNTSVIIISLLFIILFLSCGDEKENKSNLTFNDNNNTINLSEDSTFKTKSRIFNTKDIPNTITNQRPLSYQRGKQGGTMTLGDFNGDPKTYNIIVATENTSLNIIRRFLISLMHYNEDNGKWYVYPGDYRKGNTGMGYDLDMAEDGRQIMTIYLRDDVYWTDGVRMTASDWVWYWNNIYTDLYISPGGYNQALVVMENGDEELIRAEYDTDFKFRMIFPRALGEPELYVDFSPIPRHIIRPIYESSDPEAVFTMWGVDTPLTELVGNGAWKPVDYRSKEYLLFEANRSFFMKDEWGNSLPYLDNLAINLVPERSTLHLKFLEKEVDSYNIQNADFNELVSFADEEDYSIWNGGLAPEMEFVVFNQNPKSERLKDKPKLNWFRKSEFRKAISYLTDRENISAQIHYGLAEPDSTYLTKASHYFDPSVQIDNSYNPNEAINLLDSIGIRDRDGNGILEDMDNNEIRFEINTNTLNNERVRTINLLANEWKTYGIIAYVSPIDFKVLVSRLTSSYDWESVLISLEGGLFPLNDSLYMSRGNLHMWNPMQETPSTEWEAEVNKLHRMAKYEPDFETRKAIINDMFSILYDNLPMIPIVRKYTFNAVYNDFANVNWDIWTEVGGYNNLRVFKK